MIEKLIDPTLLGILLIAVIAIWNSHDIYKLQLKEIEGEA